MGKTDIRKRTIKIFRRIFMKQSKWEQQLKSIVPDSEQRRQVIRFIKEFQKAWKVNAKKSTKQESLL